MSGVAVDPWVTSAVTLEDGDPARAVDAVWDRLGRIVPPAEGFVVLALPTPALAGSGRELDDVEAWAATRAFMVTQALSEVIRGPGRAIVLVTAAAGFASEPGSVRAAVEAQAVMAVARVAAAELAPETRCCCVAVRGDLLAQADAVCGAVRFLLSSGAAHVTGQTLVVGWPRVVR